MLSAAAITALWAGRHGGPSRLAVYSLREAELALRLLDKLQIITETLEMARVRGRVSVMLYATAFGFSKEKVNHILAAEISLLKIYSSDASLGRYDADHSGYVRSCI